MIPLLSAIYVAKGFPVCLLKLVWSILRWCGFDWWCGWLEFFPRDKKPIIWSNFLIFSLQFQFHLQSSLRTGLFYSRSAFLTIYYLNIDKQYRPHAWDVVRVKPTTYLFICDWSCHWLKFRTYEEIRLTTDKHEEHVKEHGTNWIGQVDLMLQRNSLDML